MESSRRCAGRANDTAAPAIGRTSPKPVQLGLEPLLRKTCMCRFISTALESRLSLRVHNAPRITPRKQKTRRRRRRTDYVRPDRPRFFPRSRRQVHRDATPKVALMAGVWLVGA